MTTHVRWVNQKDWKIVYDFRICQKVKKKAKCMKKKNSEENEDPEGESDSSLLGPGGF